MSEMTGFELTALHSLELPDRVGDLLAISSKVPMPSTPADVTSFLPLEAAHAHNQENDEQHAQNNNKKSEKANGHRLRSLIEKPVCVGVRWVFCD